MKNLKKFYIAAASFLFTLLYIPFSFAKSATSKPSSFVPPSLKQESFTAMASSIYDSLHLDLSGLSRQAFEQAKKGMEKLMAQGRLVNDSILSIADFSLPSYKKRFFVIDLRHYKVLFNTWVAHGKNSGKEWAQSFSNLASSLKSSPGFYITDQTYLGNNGYSLKLQGVERGINDNAYERAIVLHGAAYVSQSFINAQGYIGRSEGCPAVPLHDAPRIINFIKNGSCLLIYTPDRRYLSHSALLNG